MNKKLLGVLLSSMMLISNLTTIQVHAEEDTNAKGEKVEEVTEAEDNSGEETPESTYNLEEQAEEEVTVDTEQSEEAETEEEYSETEKQHNTDDAEKIVVSDGQEEEIEFSETEAAESETKETITDDMIVEPGKENEEIEEPSYTGDLEGQAYAVLEDDGDMIFFRSTETYTNDSTGTFTDIRGNSYNGRVFTEIETLSAKNYNDIRWYSYTNSIRTARVAEGQTIHPISTRYWFYNCSNLTGLDVSSIDTSNVTNMWGMFYYCSSLTSLDVSSFDTSNVMSMGYMFYYCSSLTSLDLSSFDTSNVISMSTMFSNCYRLTSLDVSSFDTSNVTNMWNMFYYCSRLTNLDVSSFDTSNVTDMSYMFYYCRSLTSLDLSSFDTSNVMSMERIFSGCNSLTSIDLGGFNTSKVTSMQDMFSSCNNLTSLDLSGFNTSNVTNMDGMFGGCNSLTSLDLSGFNTSNVTDMGGMFSGCNSLTSLDLSCFNTSKVTEMHGMFSGCNSLASLDLSSFNTVSVRSMSRMFSDCSSLISLDLSSFDTYYIADMTELFSGCSSLTDLDLSSFNTTQVSTMYRMFYNCNNLSSVKLGKKFYKWGISGCLPTGIWTNREINISLTENELCLQYPVKASNYAGTWRKNIVNGVSLNKESLIIALNSTEKLEAVVSPDVAFNKNVIWSSSNENVASVDNNGTVKGLYQGTAEITVTTEDGGYTATCEVTVIQPVTGITLDKDEITLNVGETELVIASISPDDASIKKVIWSSDDESVATVDDNGEIVAVGKGTAMITATTEDGGYTATCKVAVALPVEGISLNEKELMMNVGETKILEATIEPADANNQKVTWISSDENVVTVDENGMITLVGRGTATITATTEDGGYTATCIVSSYPEAESIKMDYDYLEMLEGETQVVKISFYPENAVKDNVIWASTDVNVVEIDQNGKITAVSGGTALITAKTETGLEAAPCTVRVYSKIKSINFDSSEMLLYVGEGYALHPVVDPEEEIKCDLTYTSSNPSVVTVSEDGILTAISTGSSVITVKDSLSGNTAQVTVSVKNRVAGSSKVIDNNVLELKNYILANGKNGKEIFSETTNRITKETYSASIVYNSEKPNIIHFSGSYDNQKGNVKIYRLCTFDLDYSTGITTIKIYVDYYSTSGGLPAHYYGEYTVSNFYKYDNDKLLPFIITEKTGIFVNQSDSDLRLLCSNDFHIILDYINDTLVNMCDTPEGFESIGLGTVNSDKSEDYYKTAYTLRTNPDSVTIFPGDTMTVELVPVPEGSTINGTIEWVNDFPDYVEVYGVGENRIAIRALQPGAGGIRIYMNGRIEDDLSIRIINPLSLKNGGRIYAVGSEDTIGVTLTRYKETDLVWSSDDPNIIFVDQHGHFTALSPGTTTIRIKTRDGLFETKRELTVQESIGLKDISLSKHQVTMLVNETANLSVSYQPSSASGKKLYWSSSNRNAATVDNGKLTAKGIGRTTITVISEEGGYEDTCDVLVLFHDVTSPSQYYFDAVYWAVDKGITQGTSPTTFNPGGFCKRYQFVLFLWRQAGQPEPTLKTDPFTDVLSDPKKDVYEKAVLWAVEKGITTGTTKTTFDPYAPLTRGQVVTFLYRAAGEPQVKNWNNPFKDLDSSKYYYKPVLWAVENSITTGLNATQFGPTNTCTRGQTVLFMYRLFK